MVLGMAISPKRRDPEGGGRIALPRGHKPNGFEIFSCSGTGEPGWAWEI